MATQRQREAARENLARARATRKSTSRRQNSKAKPNGRAGKKTVARKRDSIGVVVPRIGAEPIPVAARTTTRRTTATRSRPTAAQQKARRSNLKKARAAQR